MLPKQQMSHPAQQAAQNQALREELDALLQKLFPIQENLDIITLRDILQRYRLTGLSGPALAAMAQSQRLIRSTGDYTQMGLCEFHIGLIHLHWNNCPLAADHFARARQQWSFRNETAAQCLATYAQAHALQHAEDYEQARLLYSRTIRCLRRLEQIHIAPRPNGRTPDMRAFATDVSQRVEAESQRLRDLLWPSEEHSATGTPSAQRPTAVTPPGFLAKPTQGQTNWYVPGRRQDYFLPHLLETMWLRGDRPDSRSLESGSLVIVAGTAAQEFSLGLWQDGQPPAGDAQYYVAQVMAQPTLVDERVRVRTAASQPTQAIPRSSVVAIVIGAVTAL